MRNYLNGCLGDKAMTFLDGQPTKRELLFFYD